jgi:hypothetical protein
VLARGGGPPHEQFVHEAVNEALKLEAALARLTTPQRVVLLHYSSIASTVTGEPLEVYPFLGSSRLEDLVGAAAKVLESRESSAVATRTLISGPLDDPRTSTWQVVVRLVQNAFFTAILPGLERERPSDG